ncbi:response regulator [Candidatus Daviesbacteria bacterium]|nr:response regulator [Candidatus Daviesbacteria bacterium]
MKKVFIADDDSSIVEVIKIVLTEGGFDVVGETHGKNVEESILKEMPDLVLLDVWMSGFDGREITRKLKSNPATKKIPVLLVSALSDTRQIAKDTKADGFLEKPFDIKKLLDTVKEFALK